MIYIQRYLTIAFYIFFCLIVSSCDEDAVEDPVNHESEEVSYEINEPDDNDTHQEMAELPTIIQPQPPVIQPQPERVDNTAIPCSRFKNCTELRRVHPDGVNTARLSCAKDRNKLDRDNDGWACER